MNPFIKFQHRANRYEKLSTYEAESLKPAQRQRSKQRYWIYGFVFLCSGTFFVLGSIAFYLAGSYECQAPSDWSWVDGTAVVLSVGHEEVKSARKDKGDEWFNSTVRLGDANGGGMMATLEMFHQLHCLDLVRKFTFHKYPYYKNTGGVFDKPIQAQKNHIDHCLEIIRQVIMCSGDTGLITFHWVAGNPVAYPDFNTWHSCRDPEEILALAKEREAPMRQQVTKTQEIINMPTPP
ncbi:hypothetical protein GGS24DRAFT_503467 [Hypoxylon argillaceum]|nr:hypothetical protein GGS24DRAFT_503467 [Hypoxylon argillaceum]